MPRISTARGISGVEGVVCVTGACPLCGEHRSIHHLVDYEAFCAAHATTQESAVGPAPNREISAPDLAERLAAEPDLLLLDVREAWEWELCRIAGAQLMPLSEFAARLPDLPPDRPIVTYCHAGVRSLKALDQLRAAGYTAVQSLAGGIDAWSRLVDPAVSRY